ncbi:DUF3060 domain-containing protein [Sphingobium cloacae]|uniref:DUF3060 domain-containing protein n=1 Tax=Sphingobium cloacae TaxID=120107 RepID=A0A1E1F202_9SPHN|nr:DUF3060 domain-containing protein [Sphingobium cloacae]BAV64549.1 hypothetical protein SCLO_1015090 [Sphingobium cloacae]
MARLFWSGVGALWAAMALPVSPAVAQADFTGAGQTTELDCGGDSASITGASNQVHISGSCRLLTIEGADNRIHVSMAKGGVIRLTGASNEIHWSTPDGSRPRIQITGADNRISQMK